MSGWLQWWPARTATPSQSSTWATSCGWTPSTSKETMPARRSGGGPKSARLEHLQLRRARSRGARARGARSRRGRSRSGSRSPRRARPPRRSERCRPRTCAAARSTSSRSTVTLRIMWPPSSKGDIASKSSAAPEDADPGRPAHLVAREREEVAAERLHVDRSVRAAWAASTTTIAPCSCAQATSRSTGLTVPSEFETWATASTLTLPARRERRARRAQLARPASTGIDHELGAGSPRRRTARGRSSSGAPSR